jgi:NAD(P)-dependent dehydrogenase (short-subunit alcohol dehydrogenase family)
MLEHLVKYAAYRKQLPDFNRKHVLLLGATGGIGSAVKVAIERSGCALASVSCPSSKEVNLEDPNLTDVLIKKFPDTQVLINCAGIAVKDDLNILYGYDKHMQINFRSNACLIEYAKRLRILHDKKINIVLISSSSATKGREGLTMYSASKAAVHSLVESQSMLLAEQNVYLNCICPEKVNTSLAVKLHGSTDVLELLTPDEVAKSILSYSTTSDYGQIIHVRKGMDL